MLVLALASGCSPPTGVSAPPGGSVVIEGTVASESGEPIGDATLAAFVIRIPGGTRLGPISVGVTSPLGAFSGLASTPWSDGTLADIELISQPPFGASLAPDTATFEAVRLRSVEPDTIHAEFHLRHAGGR